MKKIVALTIMICCLTNTASLKPSQCLSPDINSSLRTVVTCAGTLYAASMLALPKISSELQKRNIHPRVRHAILRGVGGLSVIGATTMVLACYLSVDSSGKAQAIAR